MMLMSTHACSKALSHNGLCLCFAAGKQTSSVEQNASGSLAGPHGSSSSNTLRNSSLQVGGEREWAAGAQKCWTQPRGLISKKRRAVSSPVSVNAPSSSQNPPSCLLMSFATYFQDTQSPSLPPCPYKVLSLRICRAVWACK